MGNFYSSSLNQKNDNKPDKDTINKKETFKCIRVIRSHKKWCNCIIKLKLFLNLI